MLNFIHFHFSISHQENDYQNKNSYHVWLLMDYHIYILHVTKVTVGHWWMQGLDLVIVSNYICIFYVSFSAFSQIHLFESWNIHKDNHNNWKTLLSKNLSAIALPISIVLVTCCSGHQIRACLRYNYVSCDIWTIYRSHMTLKVISTNWDMETFRSNSEYDMTWEYVRLVIQFRPPLNNCFPLIFTLECWLQFSNSFMEHFYGLCTKY